MKLGFLDYCRRFASELHSESVKIDDALSDCNEIICKTLRSFSGTRNWINAIEKGQSAIPKQYRSLTNRDLFLLSLPLVNLALFLIGSYVMKK